MKFIIEGQIRGGKNHINITRTGRRYPNKNWAIWCDQAVRELLPQKAAQGQKEPFSTPLWLTVEYVPGDLRKRDSTAILDAIYHCLEKAEIVTDDCLFEDVRYLKLPLNRKRPRAEFTITEL